MKYFLGIDLGTSSLKTVLYSEEFKTVATISREYEMIQPHNGWAEQNSTDWIAAVDSTFKELKENHSKELESLMGIGLTGQMHGLVMLDENDNVLRPPILWCDQRTEEECDDINNIFGDEIIKITANPALTGFTLSKILWVQKHEPELYKQCKHILLPKDYLRFYLSGDYATDVSDASGMQILDVPNRTWSKKVCDTFNIDMDMLPKLYESVEPTGYLKENLAEGLGIKHKVTIAAGAGDNAAAAIGCGVVNDGETFATIGTSGVVFTQSDTIRADEKGRIHTFCSAVPNTWHVMGVTQGAGLSVNWFKDNFYKDIEESEIYKKIEEDINKSSIGSNKLIYLPYLMGERTPHLDPNARGAFIGLSAMHEREDLMRAVIEGVTFSLRDCLEIIRHIGLEVDNIYLTGGGANNDSWIKILTDNFNSSIEKIKGDGGTNLGAAILASMACGHYTDLKEVCSKYISYGDKYEVNESNLDEYSKYYDIYQKSYYALKDLYVDLAKI
ncbi:xylulokinase [Anaerosphaera aminiphila DSM 21120]|uniref:Xylulose kinase n=1 Tax=Anaerosphaera aminiphila DSM 21120 TaxID=1120995 RepID=A0A1M5PP84_9FIRM|nr:xylulokinase [Anaerosphaera aminiphila]SHH03645.1 xylulokinase [Anaerosphaera aminiphila DSM 21120]